MKISILKKPINLNIFLIGFLYFFIIAVVFFNYSINFSPLILAFILIIYGKFSKRIENVPSYLDLALLAALAILVSITLVITFKISGYGMPAIGFAILITLLFDSLEIALLFSIFVSFLGASIDNVNFSALNVGVSLFTGALAGIMFSYRARRRFQVIRAGLFAGGIQFIAAFITESMTFIMTEKTQSFSFISGFDFVLFRECVLGGLISSIVILGILPVFEYVFKIVTNISLLELSDFNHPILRRLILEAPGTYQHSLVVANLSEAASEAIGANSLLARVGSYYHDIGKMLKPHYFVENQAPFRDVHKDLKPSMSKLIIVNHVKEGVELAKKHRINTKIIDFITQHHGRTLVYYFYHRAKELEPEGEHEEEYRYPGPKPQTKEVAIVSLADTIEALSRTLDEPTPSRIEEMIREVVRKKFMEGELDDTDLTLKDLGKITQSFTRILNALFHTRINYPKADDKNTDDL